MATLKNLVDETTVIKNELKSCHANLKNSLTSKGVSCGSSDKISTLIGKIDNIQLGKKYASGTCPNISNTGLLSTWKGITMQMGLNFTPSRIVLTCENVKLGGYLFGRFTVESELNNSSDRYLEAFNNSNARCRLYISNVTQNSFVLYIFDTANQNSTVSYETLKWYAYE